MNHISDQQRAWLEAYSAGINDFINSIDFASSNGSAKLLPPEFYAFGITGENLELWKPEDSLAFGSMMSFHLTWNWGIDYIRQMMIEIDPELAELVDEMLPFTADNINDRTFVLDDDDLKQFDLYSEETLTERYHRNKETIERAKVKTSQQSSEGNRKIEF